jgi:hypothetical protein
MVQVIKAMLTGTRAKVKVGKEESEEFQIEQGVKQGSVLSPSLFVAVMDWVLHEALDGKISGVEINGLQLTDLDFADDVLLITEGVEEAQKAINRVQEVGRKVGLELNEQKTVWIANNIGKDKLFINGVEIERSESFVYLGSLVDAEGGMSGEVERRIEAANRAFWSFRGLWKSKFVSLKTKGRVYAACVRSTLLYGAENWALTEKEMNKVAVFDRKKLRWVAGVKWFDKVSNLELMKLVKLPQIDTYVMRRRWQWLGHILRMSPTRWPRRVLFWNEEEQMGATRSVGAPKKSWTSMVAKESWDKIQCSEWIKMDIPRPSMDFVSWKKGECWRWLRTYAIFSRVWRKIVDFVSSTEFVTARCGQRKLGPR